MTALVTTSTTLSATLPSVPRPPPRAPVARLRLRSRLRRHALLRCDAVSELASAAYGVLLLGGGVFAYARSGSKGSIYWGLAGSGLMGIAYYLMQSPETKAAGDAVGFGSAFLFACVFGIRLYNSRKLGSLAFSSPFLLVPWVLSTLLTCKTRRKPIWF
ncbi:hypothetical protein PVAP13_7KG309700 [Panicum virgatum]|uniref:Uncharacterized protein n=1 Tax=Panicum virgatum TaxID=38727 RepID=A0A8T0QMA8_PANVG|nr:hypothetical protein PVAP13_7KG309700 [Panicum virgatum]